MLRVTQREINANATREYHRHESPLPWTGITEPRCDVCIWCYHDGRMELKYRNAFCSIHREKRTP
jgi:hypothetical protein